jgi:preprotein translocase subunit SecY
VARRFPSPAEASDLWNRIWFTLGALVIYRAGRYIPLPGIDPQVLQSIVTRSHGGILDMVDMFSGGALRRMTIFAVGIGPYISAAIFALFLSIGWRHLASRAGRPMLWRFILVATVAFTALEAYGIAIGLEGGGGRSAVTDPGPLFRMTTVITVTGGTIFLLWLAEQITARGIGNGVAMLIFSDIVARMPTAFASLLELGRVGRLPGRIAVAILILVIAVVAAIVFMETARRRVLVQYRPRLVGTRMFEGEGSHVRFKLNTSGIIPPFFASSLLLLPATLAIGGGEDADGMIGRLSTYLRHGSLLHIVLYVALIIFFCFFYAAILFNPKEAAKDLDKYGGVIPGCEPGKPTADHLDGVLTRLTLVGSLYLAAICVLPEILMSQYAVPFYFGGTSLLVATCIAMDIVRQIRAHLGLAEDGG